MTDAKPELNVLALNSGSSSLKFGLYRVVFADRKAGLGSGELIGNEGGKFHAEDAGGNVLFSETGSIPANRKQSFDRQAPERHRDAAGRHGHRIVHGDRSSGKASSTNGLNPTRSGDRFRAPAYSVRALGYPVRTRTFPRLPQAACFDTTFHAGLPDVARVLPIARELQFEGIQRYGFHGLSCESIVPQLANDLPHRLVIAHLGNGASVTAIWR